MAERDTEIVRLALERERLSIEAELVRRFLPVLGTRQRIALLDSLIDVSEESIGAVRRLVEAGAAMRIDLVRAELDRDELLLERSDLARALAREQTSLAELWGDDGFRFDDVAGSLVGMVDLPTIEDLTAAMKEHPAWRLPDAERQLAKAELNETRAERWPELALSAGYLQNNEADEGAVLAGLSLSLPIFDRKGAAIAAKKHNLAAAEHRAGLERLERSTALLTLYSEMEGSMMRLRVLSGDLLSRATLIHNELQDFYAQGRTGILDVLEARGHLLEVRMRILDLVEEQALLGADLVELTGYRIEIIR
jgi:cobalt-zinc-cadmium efflux system outer membrane protein